MWSNRKNLILCWLASRAAYCCYAATNRSPPKSNPCLYTHNWVCGPGRTKWYTLEAMRGVLGDEILQSMARDGYSAFCAELYLRYTT